MLLHVEIRASRVRILMRGLIYTSVAKLAYQRLDIIKNCLKWAKLWFLNYSLIRKQQQCSGAYPSIIASKHYSYILRLIWINKLKKKEYRISSVSGLLSTIFPNNDESKFIECFTTTFLHTHSWLNWTKGDIGPFRLVKFPSGRQNAVRTSVWFLYSSGTGS